MTDLRNIEENRETQYSLTPLWQEIRAEMRRNRAARKEHRASAAGQDGRPRTRSGSAHTGSARPGSVLRPGRHRARDESGRR